MPMPMPMPTSAAPDGRINGRPDGRIDLAPPESGRSWDGLDVLVLAPTPTHPLDAGNRRRIFFVNDALQRLGARITFVHYPAEGDWRERVPSRSVAAMAGQWHGLYTVPVTRSLHDAARDEDHTIDEWWDPAIGDLLRWLFRTHRFDVFIVNYACLSKAFEFCPRNVLKILDTHDRFSGRRHLLGSRGIAPEFFHTTEEQERIALDRADVVWAIKSHEAVFFRTITRRPVIEIPHVEPIAGHFRAAAKDRLLRFGIAGAANSINLANIRAFLAEAEAYIRRTLLPCELVIAGSICDLLPDLRLSWVRRLGRLDDMAAFYAAVDVVLAPVTFSTGLKIKVGEALCQGKAVVALDHAFEGYRALHPFHTLPSIAEMLRACRRIVNDPGLIDELEQASVRSVILAQQVVAGGLRDSIAERWRVDPGVCIVIDAADVHPGSIVVDHVRETAQYVGHLGPVFVFVNGLSPVPDPATLRALGQAGMLMTTPELQAALGPEGIAALEVDLLRVRTLRSLLRDPHYAFWFASCPGSWPVPARPRPGRAYVACDSVVQSTSLEALPGFLAQLRGSFAEVVVLSRRGVPALTRPELASWSHRIPLLWRGDHSLIVPALRAGEGKCIVILAADATDPLLALVAGLVLTLSSRPVKVVLPGRLFPAEGAGAVAERLCADPKDRGRLEVVRAKFFFGTGDVWLALSVARDAELEAARDAFDHGGVPLADLFSTAAVPVHGSWKEPAGAHGLFESVLFVQQLLTQPGAVGQLRAGRCAARNRINDAGWARIWVEVKGLVEYQSG